MPRPFQCCQTSRDTIVRDTTILERSRHTTARNRITSSTNNRRTMRDHTMVRRRVSKRECSWQHRRIEIPYRIGNATYGRRWWKFSPPRRRTCPPVTRRGRRNWWLDRSGSDASTAVIYDPAIERKGPFATPRPSAESTKPSPICSDSISNTVGRFRTMFGRCIRNSKPPVRGVWGLLKLSGCRARMDLVWWIQKRVFVLKMI